MKAIAIFPVLAAFLAISASAQTQAISDAERHFEKANELLKRADYDGAIAEYEKVITTAGNSKIAQDAQYWIGQSQFRAGQLDTAQATFVKLIEQYPTSAIVPVTRLMVERVEEAKKSEAMRSAVSATADEGYITDPRTGVKYTKVASFAGKNDVIWYSAYEDLNLSPNGKFLLYGKCVVPIGGSEPFDLVDDPDVTGGDWSPDGRQVAFYTGGAICIVPVLPETGRPTGPVRRLFDEGAYYRGHPSWSPDGQKLAFVRGGVCTLSVADGSLTQLTTDAASGGPEWSPDGKTILYDTVEDAGERCSLCTVSADERASRKVVASLGGASHRNRGDAKYWSPDGRWILYTWGRGLRLLNVDDNRKLEIAAPPRRVGAFFSWSPDGRKVLFYRKSYVWRAKVRVMSASGGPSVGLEGPATWPEHRWSPDSKAVLVAGYRDGRYGMWISPLSGGDPVLLEIDVSVGEKFLVYEVSPTGDKLALVVDRDSGARDLYVAPVSLKDARTTGPAVKVFEGWQPRYNSDLAYIEASWSPDGTKLAVVHAKDIWIAFSNGDKPVPLAQGIGGFYPGWSPDGKMVHYTAWTEPAPEGALYVVPSDGGSPTRITPRVRSTWSPDSKKLLSVSEGSISTVTVEDGRTREIAKLKDLGLDKVNYCEWSPDGKYIACDGYENNKARPIILIPVGGGKPTSLAADDDNWRICLRWSPDDKWISHRSEGEVKVRPEGTLWEADFEEIVKSASR